jgi:hypothetical protein
LKNYGCSKDTECFAHMTVLKPDGPTIAPLFANLASY